MRPATVFLVLVSESLLVSECDITCELIKIPFLHRCMCPDPLLVFKYHFGDLVERKRISVNKALEELCLRYTESSIC